MGTEVKSKVVGVVSSTQDSDIVNLINISMEIDFNLSSLGELIEFQTPEELRTASQAANVKKLEDHLEVERNYRQQLEGKNDALEAQVAKLEQQLSEELASRKKSSKSFTKIFDAQDAAN